MYTLIDLKTSPNTKHLNVLICFQKYSEKVYKKVTVKSKALCDTQHVNLVFKMSKHTDKIT